MDSCLSLEEARSPVQRAPSLAATAQVVPGDGADRCGDDGGRHGRRRRSFAEEPAPFPATMGVVAQDDAGRSGRRCALSRRTTGGVPRDHAGRSGRRCGASLPTTHGVHGDAVCRPADALGRSSRRAASSGATTPVVQGTIRVVSATMPVVDQESCALPFHACAGAAVPSVQPADWRRGRWHGSTPRREPPGTPRNTPGSTGESRPGSRSAR